MVEQVITQPVVISTAGAVNEKSIGRQTVAAKQRGQVLDRQRFVRLQELSGAEADRYQTGQANLGHALDHRTARQPAGGFGQAARFPATGRIQVDEGGQQVASQPIRVGRSSPTKRFLADVLQVVGKQAALVDAGRADRRAKVQASYGHWQTPLGQVSGDCHEQIIGKPVSPDSGLIQGAVHPSPHWHPVQLAQKPSPPS